MKKKLVILVLISLLFSAASMRSKPKIVKLTVPPNTSALNGDWSIENGEVEAITMEQEDKEIHFVTTFDFNRFIIYGFNCTTIECTIDFTVSEDCILEFENMSYSTPDAIASSSDAVFNKRYQKRRLGKR